VPRIFDGLAGSRVFDGLAGRRPGRVALLLGGLALVIAAAVAVWLITSSSSESSASDDDLFGIASSPALSGADLNKMGAASVRSVRFLLGWPEVEPHRGSFDWAGPDQVIGGLASHGIQSVPFVFGSPPWVSPEATRPPIDSAADRAAWTEFLKAAVDRYGPGGSFWSGEYVRRFGGTEPVPITAWQIWNEPNLPHYFTAQSPAAAYSQLVRLSHDAITAQDPNAEIVLAGMPGYGKPDTAWKFLGELYRQPGFAGSFDAVALHPYARTVAQLQLEIVKLRAAMAQHGDGTTPLWLTELGWGSGKPNRFGLNKGLIGQQQLLEQSFQLILDRRDTWHVQRLFWFDWRDPPPGAPQACSFCSTAGLLKHNGFAKPSWVAYREFASGARK
jgi:polysaccharide biosynthesis protein PslG